jgi:hypothetical protein
MKTALFVLFLTLSALAQNAKNWPGACGPHDTKFEVERGSPPAKHFTATTPAAKATIYFIQITTFQVNVGIDGTWVGASKASWFAVTVDPGKHHICEYAANRGLDIQLRLRDIDAQPGEIYYFFARAFYKGAAPYTWELENIDAYDGNRLIARVPPSISRIKK